VGLLSKVLMLFWMVVSILLWNIVSMHVLSTPVLAVLIVLVVLVVLVLLVVLGVLVVLVVLVVMC
jgi:hypothetical protein